MALILLIVSASWASWPFVTRNKVLTWHNMQLRKWTKENQDLKLWPFHGKHQMNDWIWKLNLVYFQIDHSAELSCWCYVYFFFLPEYNALCQIGNCAASPRTLTFAKWVLSLWSEPPKWLSVWIYKDMFSWNLLSCLHN